MLCECIWSGVILELLYLLGLEAVKMVKPSLPQTRWQKPRNRDEESAVIDLMKPKATQYMTNSVQMFLYNIGVCSNRGEERIREEGETAKKGQGGRNNEKI